eukprot:TRINITY_DN45172_c0_g1_i2.p1 TRINITY_DN45172_c0_g1~~TRINITY_DN45172_c0_g1_i2.p1  ORF type:complete len:415 (-),score=86.97 TRINITY_DN45172_c0_g1_i2:22-1266(-)
MPNIIYITIREARDLPTTDAKVQIKFADLDTMTTETATNRDGNPEWTDDTFKIELPEDRYVQDEPMRLEVLDSNVGADDIIGKVHLDLTCLCIDTHKAEHQQARMGPGSITGWFPIYDTLRGCCGELHVKVKTTFLAERNSFRDSSLGVLFFAGGTVPNGFPDYEVKGFVEELFIEDDPEEAWQDSFRSKRNSNERRLRLFTVLSGKVRRFVGKKTCELEGNAVLGYSLHFDLDKSGGFVIARGTGTAIRIEKKQPKPRFSLLEELPIQAANSPRIFSDDARLGRTRSAVMLSAGRDGPTSISRDTNNTTSLANPQHGDLVAPVAAQSQSVQILTLESVPDGFKTKLGGLVTAHAVKLLVGKRTAARWDGWWKDVRDEVKTHAQALGCSHVLGCLLYTSPSPRDRTRSRMPSSA